MLSTSRTGNVEFLTCCNVAEPSVVSVFSAFVFQNATFSSAFSALLFKNPLFSSACVNSSSTCHVFQSFQCMLLPKSTKIPHHRAFHLSRQPPIHMHRPRSGKYTRTLQIQKLILGTRPKMTDTENNSRNPPTKLQIQN